MPVVLSAREVSNSWIGASTIKKLKGPATKANRCLSVMVAPFPDIRSTNQVIATTSRMPITIVAGAGSGVWGSPENTIKNIRIPEKPISQNHKGFLFATTLWAKGFLGSCEARMTNSATAMIARK